jgi:hypothetical protein
MVVSQTSTIGPIGVRVSLISSKYPTWCRSTIEPGCLDLMRLRVPILFNQSKRISSSIAPMITPVWKFLPRRGILSLTLELENVLFHSEHLIEWWSATQAESWSTTGVYKVPCRPLMDGKPIWETEKFSPFQRSRYLRSSTINASYIVSCAPPPSINLGTRFLLRGQGCNTLCYDLPNHHH